MSLEPPPWVTPAIGAASCLAMMAAEALRPLRRRVEARLPHLLRNLAVAAPSFAVLGLLTTPLVVPVAEWAEGHRFGVVQFAPLPAAVRTVLAVVLLDYTLWFWHFANHRVPLLWRFHLAHHVDRDLDASTALRFHVGEMALSVPVRALQVGIVGADPVSLWWWQVLLFASIVFHHSNTRLPIGLERVLVWLVVTPRMHGIHHSDHQNETDSNWSSLLSIWDRLHRTLLLAVPQHEIRIGVPAYRAPAEVTLTRTLLLPFERHRQDWRDEDGQPLLRTHDPILRTRLQA
jgi:sterol desaturase/sphingolipid hydroxylase (fatty acid hydroxylase superfamily)